MKGQVPVVALVVLLIGVGVLGLFVADVEQTEPDPVSFDRTVSVGLSLEDERWLESERDDIDLPRVQVFYSEYEYVIGYYGVEEFLTTQGQQRYERLFGYPLAVYVSAYESGSVDLTADGLPVAEGRYEWTLAEEAVYVVESDARTPAGRTVIPFEDRDDAEQFSQRNGGTVLNWEELSDRPFETDDAATVQRRVADVQREADAGVADALTLSDRPIGATVGEDGETIQDAVEAAPENTTVLVPEGLYQGHVTIEKPVTLAGVGDVSLVGSGNGTVVSIEANRTAVLDIDVSGVGMDTPGAGPTEGHDHGTHTHDHGGNDDEEWDATIEDDYARGDAGIAVDNSTGTLIEGVGIDTSASGVMVRDSSETVVRNVTVRGNDDVYEAHMGVVLMRSPAVVEHSSFTAGLDGVYTHRADGSVVRNNTMEDNRMGIHLMHTSDALLANNTITDESSTGIYIMTGPERNAVLGNEIRDSPTGLDIGGTDSYVADNVFVENRVGLRLDSVSTIVDGNVLAGNAVGVDTRSVLATNRVVNNDFVSNTRHVRNVGPLRIWTHDGEGNYWEGAVGQVAGETLTRPYSPTDDIDAVLHRVDGAPTIAQAPALNALGAFEQTVSGLRSGEVLDEAPRCTPQHRDWLADSGYQFEPDCQSEAGATDESTGGR